MNPKTSSPFGRMVAPSQGSLDQAEAFVLLGFGLVVDPAGNISPGVSNTHLASWLIEHNPKKLLTITQEGTYLGLQKAQTSQGTNITPKNLDSWVINLPHDPHVHVDTHGAALQIWLLCRQHRIRKIALVTHPYQSERARLIFDKLPLEEIIIPDIAPDSIPFTPDSSQRWTRSWFWYAIFEFVLARPIGRLFGWF